MEGSTDDYGAPDSWEVADLDAAMTKLILSCKKDSSERVDAGFTEASPSSASSSAAASSSSSSLPSSAGVERDGGASEDVINQVDQFLREALQNPRERLSILRMEQDVEKFIHDPTQQQLEFQQLPTSYLRLAAHRVAQHYSLQSMVLLDNSLPDGSGSRIIVRKTSECRRPVIRLADIPVNFPTEESNVKKLAIKQRPQRRSQSLNSMDSHSPKTNSSKSVEERKEEYNRARARIFNASNSSSSGVISKPESEPRLQENFQHSSSGLSRVEEKPIVDGNDMNVGRGSLDSSLSSISTRSGRIEKEPVVVGRNRTSNRVAVFRDREFDRKDPDYDRSYDRYMQRFDPGFGFNGGPYTMQPMYSPAVNYNTEFPQLGSVHRPQVSTEHQPRPLPQHIHGPWTAPSGQTGLGYGHPDTMMAPFNPNHVGPRSTSAVYMHSPQYPCQRPVGLPFIHHHEHFHQAFSQSHQQQPDTSFGLARPR